MSSRWVLIFFFHLLFKRIILEAPLRFARCSHVVVTKIAFLISSLYFSFLLWWNLRRDNIHARARHAVSRPSHAHLHSHDGKLPRAFSSWYKNNNVKCEKKNRVYPLHVHVRTGILYHACDDLTRRVFSSSSSQRTRPRLMNGPWEDRARFDPRMWSITTATTTTTLDARGDAATAWRYRLFPCRRTGGGGGGEAAAPAQRRRKPKKRRPILSSDIDRTELYIEVPAGRCIKKAAG